MQNIWNGPGRFGPAELAPPSWPRRFVPATSWPRDILAPRHLGPRIWIFAARAVASSDDSNLSALIDCLFVGAERAAASEASEAKRSDFYFSPYGKNLVLAG